jgi:class 3 adenylate cyclase
MRSPTVSSRTATILAADVVGYSRLIAEAEEETLHRLTALQGLFVEVITRYDGRTFNTAGDAVRAEFAIPDDAVMAALELQDKLRMRNVAYPLSRQMKYRIGLATGEVVDQDGDVHGASVSLATALEQLAEPGGICLSKALHDVVPKNLVTRFKDMGVVQSTGAASGLHAYTLMLEQPAAAAPLAPAISSKPAAATPPAQALSGAAWLGRVVVAALATSLLVVWLIPGESPTKDQKAAKPPTPVTGPSPTKSAEAPVGQPAAPAAQPPAPAQVTAPTIAMKPPITVTPPAPPASTPPLSPTPPIAAMPMPAGAQTPALAPTVAMKPPTAVVPPLAPAAPVEAIPSVKTQAPTATSTPSPSASPQPPMPPEVVPIKPAPPTEIAAAAPVPLDGTTGQPTIPMRKPLPPPALSSADCRDLGSGGKDWPGVIAACRALLADTSASPDTALQAQLTLGRALRETGKYDEAIDGLSAVLARSPTSAAFNQRGLAHFQKGARDLAIDDFTSAIKLKPDDGDALNNRAWTYYKTGRLIQAAQDSAAAIRHLGTAAYVWDTSGHIKEGLGQKDGAILDYKKALSLDDKHETSRAGLKRLGALP